jgi:hypothetical protein
MEGLRDGLSVALALSLSATMHRDEFVLITYTHKAKNADFVYEISVFS